MRSSDLRHDFLGGEDIVHLDLYEGNDIGAITVRPFARRTAVEHVLGGAKIEQHPVVVVLVHAGLEDADDPKFLVSEPPGAHRRQHVAVVDGDADAVADPQQQVVGHLLADDGARYLAPHPKVRGVAVDDAFEKVGGRVLGVDALEGRERFRESRVHHRRLQHDAGRTGLTPGASSARRASSA